MPSAKRPAYNHFNSRPHKEVDHPQPELFGLRVVISTHDLTRRSTKLEGMLTVVEIFQLTTSQGGRPSGGSASNTLAIISTHDLTRRSTCIGEPLSGTMFISTHDLTRRSTVGRHLSWNFSAFQLTTSRGGRPTVVVPSRAVASFQLTTSRGGRPSVYPVISL